MTAMLIDLFAATLLCALLVTGAVIDMRSGRLPDWVTLALVVSGLAFATLKGEQQLMMSVFGVLAGLVSLWAVREVYFHLSGRDGLGLGDAKLLAGGGAWLGPLLLAPVVFLAAILGLAFAMVLKVSGRPVTMRSSIPFGPFLSLGIATCWIATAAGWA